MTCKATQDGQVMVESSDKTWSTGEGNGKPLQCSCLENSRERGAWWAAVHGVEQSQIRLNRLSNSSNKGMAHSFIELDKAVVHVINLFSFLRLWFLFCLLSDG